MSNICPPQCGQDQNAVASSRAVGETADVSIGTIAVFRPSGQRENAPSAKIAYSQKRPAASHLKKQTPRAKGRFNRQPTNGKSSDSKKQTVQPQVAQSNR
jgi:hypothetical protein